MTRKTVLTRQELERVMIWMQLNKKYDRIMFVQKNSNGIGTVTWARFFNAHTPDRYEEIEVSDMEIW
jgi:hypothetical protein